MSRLIVAVAALCLWAAASLHAQESSSPSIGDALHDPAQRFSGTPREGEVTVTMNDVEPTGFDKEGYPTGCRIRIRVYNGSKYHIDGIMFKFGPVEMRIPGMVARTSINDDYAFDLPDKRGCAPTADFVRRNASKIEALDCSMRGLAEGDCQNLVVGESSIDADRVNAIKQAEVAKVAATTASLRRQQERNKNILEGAAQ